MIAFISVAIMVTIALVAQYAEIWEMNVFTLLTGIVVFGFWGLILTGSVP